MLSLFIGAQSGSASDLSIQALQRKDLERFVSRLGISGHVAAVHRTLDGSAIRIVIDSPGPGATLVEAPCSGEPTERRIPSRRTFLDDRGEAFAWYHGRTLEFRSTGALASRLAEVGHHLFTVDPTGRYFLVGHPNRPVVYVRSTAPPFEEVGEIPLYGPSTRIFVLGNELLAVGQRDELMAITYELSSGQLTEVQRRVVPSPRVWFVSSLSVADANIASGHILLGLHRDGPFTSLLYVYDQDSGTTSKVGALPWFPLFLRCNPLLPD